MSDYNRQLFNNIADKNWADANSAFKKAMAEKVLDSIDIKRVEIAKKLGEATVYAHGENGKRKVSDHANEKQAKAKARKMNMKKSWYRNI